MKKTLAIFLSMAVLLCAVPHMAFAATVTEGGITYSLNDSTKTATLTNGKNASSNDVLIPGSFNYNDVDYSVTAIDDEAFHGGSLQSVEIPDSVQTIGNYAFNGCRSLTSVTIGNSVTTIGEYAFIGCSVLTSVTIPVSVTSIGNKAFYNCSGLTAINVDSANPNYKSDESGVLFNKAETELIACPGGKTGSYTIPSGVTTIGNDAFYNCRGLTSVTIPNSVQTIGDFAFEGCSSLPSLEIPGSVTSIGQGVCLFCSGLQSITIPCNFDKRKFNHTSIDVNTSDSSKFTIPAGGITGTFVLKHDCEDWAITREPTCTTAGEKTGTCKNGCGTTVTETIPATGHSIVSVPEVKATCTKAGIMAHYKCSECDALFSDADGTTSTTAEDLATDMAPHTLTSTSALASTCVTEGMNAYWTCSECHGIFSDAEGKNSTTLEALTTDKAKHTLTHHQALDSTCVTGGRKEYWTCSKCHGIFSDAAGKTSTTLDELKLEALGHDIKKVEKVESTCVKTGTKEHWECSRCHTLFSDENGETSVKEEDLTLPKLDHDWGTGEVATAATPEKPGEKTYKCSRCSETKTEPVEYISVPGTTGGDNNSTNSYSDTKSAVIAKRASIKTGDQLGIWMMFDMALLLISAYGVLVGVRFRRKRYEK